MENSIEVSNDSKFFMILKTAMNVPGVQVKRNEFLRKELSKHFSEDIVNIAIEKNPAYAGISVKQLESIAKSCIIYETNKVTAISTLAGIPGGIAIVGTVPADTAQYFAHIIRILQKLIYIYGWKELYSASGDFDDDTINQLTLFIGVMFGVNAANSVVAKLAKSTAIKVEKSLINKALTKGTIYPIVKKIAGILGVKMTKEVFAKGVGKIIPVLGGGISGALTYATFRPSANRLKKHLRELPTADVDFYKISHDDYVEVEFDDEIDVE